jgi:uncharacterized membrane protein
MYKILMNRSPSFTSLAWLCMIVLLGSADALAESPEPEMPFALDDSGRLVRFDRDIAPVLRKRCLECHNEEDARGDFRVDDRETLLGYIEPDDAESSTLFADYLTIDDEDMLMPPRTHGGPLSASELATIRVWINEGADWPENVQLVSADADDKVTVAAAPPTTLLGRAWAAQGFLHPATVHFPVALLLLGAAFVVLGWKWPAVGMQIPLACLLIGAITAIASTAMGFAFAAERGYGSWNRFDAAIMEKEVFWHRWSGVAVSVLAAFFSVIALLSLRTKNARMTTTWKAGLLVCAAVVGLVGHKGGEMSYGEDFYPKMFRTLLGSPEPDEKAGTVSATADEPEKTT